MTTTFHRHWRDVSESAWRWPNFSPAEIACRGTGKLLVNEPALDKLQALRDRLGKPLIVRSAYRSPEHNRAVGGAGRSKHLDGAAFDIAMTNHDPVAFEAAARAVLSSSARRRTNRSRMSSASIAATTVMRGESCSTSPSAVSRRSASRSGVRLTPRRSACSTSASTVPAARDPDWISSSSAR